ncbi:unnamed protein product [Zymoseptoria tritici ST99CH_1A5]|nr:unnamed protein product [Zymoseptoria tritici ST99CH_1A5]
MRFFATLCFLSTLLIPFATAQMGPECQYKNICDCCTPQGSESSDSTGYCHTKDNGNTHYCLPPAVISNSQGSPTTRLGRSTNTSSSHCNTPASTNESQTGQKAQFDSQQADSTKQPINMNFFVLASTLLLALRACAAPIPVKAPDASLSPDPDCDLANNCGGRA